MSFASLTSMDDELYRLCNLRTVGSMVGRRISIQAVWRITALMFISSICHLCQTHPLPSNDTLTQLLQQEMLATMGDFSSIIPTLISCIAGYSKQHYSLATLAIHFALDDWRILGIKLLSFFSTHWICQGPIQDIWLRRLTSPLSVGAGTIPSAVVVITRLSICFCRSERWYFTTENPLTQHLHTPLTR
jgi:hypothetical protein